eukprot:Skav215873  [mRNA]  locus=scaffold2770:108778:109011:- [translate_table: standard]
MGRGAKGKKDEEERNKEDGGVVAVEPLTFESILWHWEEEKRKRRAWHMREERDRIEEKTREKGGYWGSGLGACYKKW